MKQLYVQLAPWRGTLKLTSSSSPQHVFVFMSEAL
jgi:hypothetical protein